MKRLDSDHPRPRLVGFVDPSARGGPMGVSGDALVCSLWELLTAIDLLEMAWQIYV